MVHQWVRAASFFFRCFLCDHRSPYYGRSPGPEWLWGEKARWRVDHRQPDCVGVAAQDQVGQDLARQVRWCDAVACVAQRVEEVAGFEGAEHRQVRRRHVDRAAPRVFQGDVGEARKHEAKALRGLGDGAGVVGECVIDRRPGAPASAAKSDPAVARRPEIAQRGSEVGDELPAGPADRRQALGRRRRQNDVRAPGDEPALELRPAGRPGVECQHGVFRSDGATRRGHDGGRPGLEACRRRSFVDLDSALEDHAAEAAHQHPGLHRRAVAHESSATERRRLAAGADLGRAQLAYLVRSANLAGQPDHLFAQLFVCVRGDRVHVSGALERGADAVRPAELADRIDALGDRAARLHRGLRAVERDQALQLVPPAAGKTAVAAAGPASADVLLEDHDPEVGSDLGQEVSGPEAGESTPYDRDIGCDVLSQRGAIWAGLVSEGLAKPPASLGAGLEGVPDEIKFGRQIARHYATIAPMSLSEILQIIALIVFIVAAVGWSWGKTDLIAIGLALWVLSLLIDGRLGHLSLAVVLLLLAFIAFVLAAIGWGYKKIGLIAVGLALWAASIVIPKFIS